MNIASEFVLVSSLNHSDQYLTGCFGYQVYNTSKDIPVSTLPTNRTTYSYTMGNLEYDNEYNISIAAVNHNGVEGERAISLPL